MIAGMPSDRVDLESKLAMLEHTVDSLSGELIAQQKRLDRLQDDLTSVLQQLKRKPGDDTIEPHDTRPPHWGG